jgi:hypothetical protein
VLLLGLLKPSAAFENEPRQPASVDCDLPGSEIQGAVLQEQGNKRTHVDPAVVGVGLLWGVGGVGDETPIVLIRERGSMASPMEVLKIVEDVAEIGLASGPHGIVETDGLGWEMDSGEDPVDAAHIDWDKQVAQVEKVNVSGPLAHGSEAVGVGAGLVGKGVCPDLKQFGVKLGSKTITALAGCHEGLADAQVKIDQQGSAGMNARVVQPLAWPKTPEASHRHLCGPVARDLVVVGVS